VIKGAAWIIRKRAKTAKKGPLHRGLLPAGFSAEHLGPSDFYFWDNFWAIAGLESAARMCRAWNDTAEENRYRLEAEDYRRRIDEILGVVRGRHGHSILPSAPTRRLDTGVIGSLAAGYPLKLWPADDPRLVETARFIRQEYFVNGGFFHNMTHSGINPYLTLHVAQVLLRAGDERFGEPIQAVASLASDTGQWPEAVHPQTLGGCMGDGHHTWASAEWILMMRQIFIREEGDQLILGSGIPESWFESGASFGPAPTDFGPVRFSVKAKGGRIRAEWAGEWHGKIPRIEIRFPGYPHQCADPGQTFIEMDRSERL
jgi:hypothetical protein